MPQHIFLHAPQWVRMQSGHDVCTCSVHKHVSIVAKGNSARLVHIVPLADVVLRRHTSIFVDDCEMLAVHRAEKPHASTHPWRSVDSNEVPNSAALISINPSFCRILENRISPEFRTQPLKHLDRGIARAHQMRCEDKPRRAA